MAGGRGLGFVSSLYNENYSVNWKPAVATKSKNTINSWTFSMAGSTMLAKL